MASERWFRWYHGTVTDPKWRVIASRCVTAVTVGHVVTVWSAMLENASQAVPRGVLSGWCDEDVAALFGYETEQVSAIRAAMQGKVLDGDKLMAWEKRQPNREDSSATRTREYRARMRDAYGDDVTRGDARDASDANVTPRGDKRREEQKARSKALERVPQKRGTALPQDWQPSASDVEWVTQHRSDVDIAVEADKFRDYWRAVPGAKGRKLDWPATWRNWVRNASRQRGHHDGKRNSGVTAQAEADLRRWCAERNGSAGVRLGADDGALRLAVDEGARDVSVSAR